MHACMYVFLSAGIGANFSNFFPYRLVCTDWGQLHPYRGCCHRSVLRIFEEPEKYEFT